MNPPKCDELDFIHFLIAAQSVFCSVEASQTHPAGQQAPARDTYTRLLQRLPPDSQALWGEVRAQVHLKQGVLVVDDSTLDKSYASHMALVSRHWSGKDYVVVQGINLISLVWTDRDCCLPCDFRICNKSEDGLSKNDHFQELIHQVAQRGFSPELVMFDSWYSGLPNLNLLRSLSWHRLTQLTANREVSVDRSGNRAVSDIFIPVQGRQVHLNGYGQVKVFRTVGTNGDAVFQATSRLKMTIEQAASHDLDAW